MSGASEATTEQYFSSDSSMARRALVSSAPSPSIVRPSRHRMVISTTFVATSVPASGAEAYIQAIVAEARERVIFEQPVEGRPEMQLQSYRDRDPEVGALGVGPAGVVAGEAEPAASVGRRHLLVPGKAIQRLETPHVAIRPAEHSDLP